MKSNTIRTAITLIILSYPWLGSGLFGKAAEPRSKEDSGHDHSLEEDKHEHGKEHSESGEKHEHDKEHSESGEKHEHGHSHEEERTNVGPDKGVTAADEDKGFVVKEQVETNFSIKKHKIKASTTISVPKAALLFSGLERQVFRNRETYWKAVDVKILKQSKEVFEISSTELQAGDSIAISGVGFLKIIEQSVFGPVIEGHVH